MAPLTDLPDAIVHHCMSFLADPKSFRALEKSCRCFRDFFSDDQVWQYCCNTEADSFWNESFRESEYCIHDAYPPAHEGRVGEGTSFRDEAFRESALDMIWYWQREEHDPILEDVFAKKWDLFTAIQDHANIICHTLDDQDNYRLFRFCLRGDALTVLMQTVENSLIQQLKSAMRLAVHRSKPGEYPSVSASDLMLQDQVRQDVTGCLEPIVPRARYDSYDSYDDEDQEEITRVVRRLAYRAGIAKMENDLYFHVWATLDFLCFLLLFPGSIELASRQRLQLSPFDTLLSRESFLEEHSALLLGSPNYALKYFLPRSWHERVYLDKGEHWWNALPNPVYSAEKNGFLNVGHMLMPWHITDAAKRLGIQSTAYNEDMYEKEWPESPVTGPPKSIVKLMFVEYSTSEDGNEGEEVAGAVEVPEEEDMKLDLYEEESLSSLMEL